MVLWILFQILKNNNIEIIKTTLMVFSNETLKQY